MDKQKPKQLSTNNSDENNPMLTPMPSKKLKNSESIEEEYFEKRKSIIASQSVLSVKQHSKWCFCLFGEQKNDFFSDSRRKSTGRFLRGSSSILNRDKNGRKKSLTLSRPPSILTHTDESFATLKNLSSIQEVNLKSNLKSRNSESKLSQVIFHMNDNKINETSEGSSYEEKR
ncbi:hypothetical protein BpHYR1_036370 [Brachionus plicatilis]|uniref:Uncharacterized protein n=1 Tax=Brachionus plicatilis TaxID=10195 RepID=A0A3M7P7K7_BRAPC|nr:hypothetical protein BpHYR1_036370 [Brachionus plicatilis]